MDASGDGVFPVRKESSHCDFVHKDIVFGAVAYMGVSRFVSRFRCDVRIPYRLFFVHDVLMLCNIDIFAFHVGDGHIFKRYDSSVAEVFAVKYEFQFDFAVGWSILDDCFRCYRFSVYKVRDCFIFDSRFSIFTAFFGAVCGCFCLSVCVSRLFICILLTFHGSICLSICVDLTFNSIIRGVCLGVSVGVCCFICCNGRFRCCFRRFLNDSFHQDSAYLIGFARHHVVEPYNIGNSDVFVNKTYMESAVLVRCGCSDFRDVQGLRFVFNFFVSAHFNLIPAFFDKVQLLEADQCLSFIIRKVHAEVDVYASGDTRVRVALRRFRCCELIIRNLFMFFINHHGWCDTAIDDIAFFIFILNMKRSVNTVSGLRLQGMISDRIRQVYFFVIVGKIGIRIVRPYACTYLRDIIRLRLCFQVGVNSYSSFDIQFLEGNGCGSFQILGVQLEGHIYITFFRSWLKADRLFGQGAFTCCFKG